MTGLELAAVAAAALMGATAQSATGFGVALPLAPVLFAVAEPPDAVLMVLVGALGHNLLVLVTRHRHLDARRGDVAVLVAGAMPGLVIGALLVTSLPKPALQFAVGAAIALALALRLHAPAKAERRGLGTGAPVGFLAGLLTTTVGINGPPMVLWLRAGGRASLGCGTPSPRYSSRCTYSPSRASRAVAAVSAGALGASAPDSWRDTSRACRRAHASKRAAGERPRGAPGGSGLREHGGGRGALV